MPTRELIRLAKDDGAFHSQNTFDRARRLADVESIRPGDLRDVLGPDRYAALGEEERRVFWVRVRPVTDPPLEEWGLGGDSPSAPT